MYKILLDGENIWGASYGGGLISCNTIDKSDLLITSSDNTALPLTNDTIYSLHKDTSGIIWVGTHGGAINRIIPGWENFELWNQGRATSESTSQGAVDVIFEESSGNIWISNYNNGLDLYDRDNDIFIHYQHDPENPDSLSNDIVNFVYEDAEHKIWIGTNQGLNLYQEDSSLGLPPVWSRSIQI